MVLRFWQPATSNETVRASRGDAWTTRRGSPPVGCVRSPAQKGLQAFLIQAQLRRPRPARLTAQRPVIVGTLQVDGKRGYPHYEVVVGVNPRERKVLTADPAEGWRERNLDEFEAALAPLPPPGAGGVRAGSGERVAWADGTNRHHRPPVLRPARIRQRRLDLRPPRRHASPAPSR